MLRLWAILYMLLLPELQAAEHLVLLLLQTAAAAAKVVVSVDVPSIATGTGEALLLDGQDVGLV